MGPHDAGRKMQSLLAPVSVDATGVDLLGERMAGADLQRTVTQAFSLSMISGFCCWLRVSPERLPIFCAEQESKGQE